MQKDKGVELKGVVLSGEVAVAILSELEYFLISLRNMGLYYYVRDEVTEAHETEYRMETARFVGESNMVSRLEKIKSVLLSEFLKCYGEEELEDFRRKLRRKRYWKVE